MDKIVRKYISYVKKILIKELGRVALTDVTLNKYGRKLFGDEWKGCSDQSEFKPTKGYHIINTAYKETSPGIHWMPAYVDQNGKIHISDSYCRNERKLLHKINKKFIIEDPVVGVHNFQKGYSPYCGHISLAWLLAVKNFGIDNVKNI